MTVATKRLYDTANSAATNKKKKEHVQKKKQEEDDHERYRKQITGQLGLTHVLLCRPRESLSRLFMLRQESLCPKPIDNDW